MIDEKNGIDEKKISGEKDYKDVLIRIREELEQLRKKLEKQKIE